MTVPHEQCPHILTEHFPFSSNVNAEGIDGLFSAMVVAVVGKIVVDAGGAEVLTRRLAVRDLVADVRVCIWEYPDRNLARIVIIESAYRHSH